MTKSVRAWPVASLFDFCNPKQWPTIPQSTFVDRGYPVYGANGQIGYYTEFNHEKPTVLITCRGATCGTINVCPAKSYVTGNSMALDDLDESLVNAEYLVHALRNGSLSQAISGTAQPQITRQSLTAITIPLPPITEQRRIAEILDKADALRAKRRAALAQLDTLTQAIFLDLFGDAATNPKGWPRIALKDLGKVKTGGTPPSSMPNMFGGSIPFVTPGDLESDAPVKRHVTEAGATESETVRPGATLVCCIGATIGKIGSAAVRSAFNQQINAVEWDQSIHDTYGYTVLRFLKPTIVARAASTTLPILKKSAFERIEIPVPPMELQTVFSSRIGGVHALAGSSKISLAGFDELFRAVQHRAFRGEI